MGLLAMNAKRAEKKRLEFISRCKAYDTPRLENEVFPDGVTVMKDISYDETEGVNGLLDIYFPGTAKERFDEAFFLIHGGAFVYGSKELDQNYGMHLALRSGLPVININYTLMPGKDLSGVCEEICAALNFLAREYGIAKIHTTGDSAGGYLALITALFCNDDKMRDELHIKTDPMVNCLSGNMICGGFKRDKNDWSRFFMDPSGRCPDYIYDMGKAVVMSFGRTHKIPLCNVTGDRDSMLRECRYLQKICEKEGIGCRFYNGKSSGERKMYHVYPISHPEWPESQEIIGMFAENAKA
ncbi:MAG: alpha/beta hydrolase [Clostridiales bacterium]|nr:alpha/beta hydrolase [Clostridiales bacterium]